jgi:hypothetical protein
MDSISATGTNLWTAIKSLPGVFRCDPCRRMIDLGKWNILCALNHHSDICKWLNDNLVDLWNSIPGKDELLKIVPFPVPERLSKGRRASSGSSVASGLTDASPVEDYFRKLERNLNLPKIPSSAFRNAWNKNFHVDDISYAFNVTEFPNLSSTNKSTATTAQETASIANGNATAVSAITEGYVSNTVKSSITEFENRRKSMDEIFEARMATLEKQVGNINHRVEAMATKIQEAIVQALTDDNGIISQQYTHIINLDKKVDNQDQKLNMMAAAVNQMSTSIADLLARDRHTVGPHPVAHGDHTPTAPPNRKIRRTDNDLARPPSTSMPTKAPGTQRLTAPDPQTTNDTPMETLPPESPLPNRQ